MIPLSKQPKYRTFTQSRNRVLEGLMLGQREKITAALVELRTAVVGQIPEFVEHRYTVDEVDHFVRPAFNSALWSVVAAYKTMRRLSYTLAYVGEAEAIARTTGRRTQYHLPKEDLQEMVDSPSPSGGSVQDRAELYLDRLRRRVLDKVQLAIVQEDSPTDAMARVHAAFPAVKTLTQPRRMLPPPRIVHSVQEADRVVRAGQGVDTATGFVDEATWSELVDSYLDEYLPQSRGEAPFRYKTTFGKRAYATKVEWELERDFTHDFVTMVRTGQLDVARENGYTDFVWIAVLDSKTDDCCLWRDGLTTKEIERELSGGHRDDECATTVPPAHPNCRCDISPVTDAIERFEQPELGDFDQWLKN